ncbi:hypothetical protein BS333_03975 [Vibrio azureus]|uniref:Putative oxidoreductase n=1 Tax=Vibrio azureus NBRC 104587 TaxID=1219077 RepID=U3ABV2_9VIBR|nr:NAD(P)/FAD-dependent oxidoreductase [Vibrio azureus]AUI85592.1 hypothetical protein BS333_03975 [Vibrio azureus]GAD77396.1 putative oxidoreductase [Vibrio azureus NBRC 104587]
MSTVPSIQNPETKIEACIIVGAGQAGLSLAYQLKQKKITPLIIDKEDRVGDVWRRRPDGMLLFTSRQFCQLPGLALEGEPSGYPDKEEIADYFEHYSKTLKLRVVNGVEVTSVRREKQIYEVTCSNGKVYQALSLVNATGANQKTIIPDLSQHTSPDVLQLTASDYRNVSSLQGNKNVAVIGDGASGRQIAAQLAEQHLDVTLFCGSKRALVPNRILGKDLFWWLHHLGFLYADAGSLIGKILKKRNPIPVKSLNDRQLKKMGVRITSKLRSAHKNIVSDQQGENVSIDAIIWCVGYREVTDWLPLEGARDKHGFCCESGIHKGGYTALPGMFLIGRKWLSSRSSELLAGMPKDSLRVANFIERYLQQHPALSRLELSAEYPVQEVMV